MLTIKSKRNYWIHPREEVTRRAPIEPHVLISYSTPNEVYPELPLVTNSTIASIYFWVHDLDRDPGQDFRGTFGEPIFFSEEDAKELATFLKTHLADPSIGFRVHCDGGMSRSPATALAWAEFEEDRPVIEKILNYKTPNRLIANRLLKALRGELA